MKKVVFIAVLIISFGLFALNFSACSKDNNYNFEISENSNTEEFEGEVTYYDKVVIDDNNYLLKIKTSDSEISFNVLPTTKIVGAKTISIGDNIHIKDIKEDDNSTYREAIEIEILSNNK